MSSFLVIATISKVMSSFLGLCLKENRWRLSEIAAAHRLPPHADLSCELMEEPRQVADARIVGVKPLPYLPHKLMPLKVPLIMNRATENTKTTVILIMSLISEAKNLCKSSSIKSSAKTRS